MFDYSEPLENYPPERRAEMVELGKRASERGEPWLSHFDPINIARELEDLGFRDREDLDLDGIALRYLGGGITMTPGAGPHIIRARHMNS